MAGDKPADEAPRALTPEETKARKRRNLMIALGLVAFIIIVFLVTLFRIGENITQWGGL
ncbi:MAG: protoheme IX farnesyltransferase [Maricaulaceae bacterium]|nr:protoheme IX farnesyltransferase [Maricaulaceae bacterium]